MGNVRYCNWCNAPIEQSYGFIAINNGNEFCSWDCFDDYVIDYFEVEEKE